ncbi:MAG: HD domain-containing protein [Phycisphaerales bacterium]|nr:MAG: HD domain-containing protein [Phycisphaerales bacterium]
MVRCPGQDQRFWKPQDIFEVDCANCGKPVEFFKDEPQLKCRQCGHAVINPKIDLGCAEWCQYAEQCLGVRFSSLTIVRQKLIDEMKEVFSQDEKRIEHALAVLDYAERIQAVEGGDPLVVRAAAILHDIGIQKAQQKHGSSAGKYQEIEGPPIAADILKQHDIPHETVEHVCRIIADHHSAKDIDTTEFRILWDADRLVNIPADFPEANKEKLAEIIDKTFKTRKGQRIAAELFLKN